jgi:hypothetical protein
MIQINFQQALADRQAQQAEQLDAEWPRFVAEIDSATTAPDPDHVLSKLNRLGKTPGDLTAAIERLHRRQWLAAELASLPKYQAAHAQDSAALREERERFAPLAAAHKELCDELYRRASSLQNDIRTSQAALHELVGGCNPSLKAKFEAASRAASLIDSELRNLSPDDDRRSDLIERQKLAIEERDRLRILATTPESF